MGNLIECPDCSRSGFSRVHEKYKNCNGAGKKEIIDDWGVKKKVKCYPCQGTGKIADTDVCNLCQGMGQIEA